MKVTTKYQTICTVGYGSVNFRPVVSNPMSHGGVTHIEVRRGKVGILARYRNSTGRGREEVSEAFEPTPEQMERWERIAASSR